MVKVQGPRYKYTCPYCGYKNRRAWVHCNTRLYPCHVELCNNEMCGRRVILTDSLKCLTCERCYHDIPKLFDNGERRFLPR